MWEYLFYSFFSVSGITAVVIFLGRRIIDHSFSKNLEKHKTELNKDLEGHKAELNRLNAEFQIKLSSFQVGRIDVIKELYANIFKMESSLYKLLRIFQPIDDPTEEEKLQDVVTNGNNLQGHYSINKIYFNKDTCNQIDELLKLYKSLFNEYKIDSDNWKRRESMFFEKFNVQAKTLKEILEETFRELIGVKKED